MSFSKREASAGRWEETYNSVPGRTHSLSSSHTPTGASAGCETEARAPARHAVPLRLPQTTSAMRVAATAPLLLRGGRAQSLWRSRLSGACGR